MRCIDSSNIWSEPSTSFARSTCSRNAGPGLPHAGTRFPGHRTAQQACSRAARDAKFSPASRHELHVCRAEGEEGRKVHDAPQTPTEERIKQTLAGLDALLGIDETQPKEKDKEKEKEPASDKQKDRTEVTFTKDVLDLLAKTEAERLSPGNSTEEEQKKKAEDLSERMAKIVENARKISQTTDQAEGTPGLNREMAELFKSLSSAQTKMSPADQKRLKEKVFGPSVFYVTQIQQLAGLKSGINPEWFLNSFLVRGNLRVKVEEAFEKVAANLEKEFGDEYTAIMIPDPETVEEDDLRGGPRVAFQITLTSAIQPPESKSWQKVLTVLLGGLTLATALQLGLTANVSKVPKEVVEFLAQPDAYNGEVPASVEQYDALPYLLSALPISLSVLGIQAAHEIAHRVVAATRKLKLGSSVLLPNVSIGCFGSITPLKSMARNRKDLFDVSAAGPAAGALVSAGLFAAGLVFSKSASPDELLAVPGALLNGSYLLGSISHLVLGDVADATSVSVHPLLIAGWCGFVSTALNCLPVGSLDGGRLTLAAFGRTWLGFTSFLTYIGLGLGFLGSSLALPFGIVVLLFQRDPERNLQDTVTAPNQARQTIAAGLVCLAVLILLPMLPSSTDLGGGGFNL